MDANQKLGETLTWTAGMLYFVNFLFLYLFRMLGYLLLTAHHLASFVLAVFGFCLGMSTHYDVFY